MRQGCRSSTTLIQQITKQLYNFKWSAILWLVEKVVQGHIFGETVVQKYTHAQSQSYCDWKVYWIYGVVWTHSLVCCASLSQLDSISFVIHSARDDNRSKLMCVQKRECEFRKDFNPLCKECWPLTSTTKLMANWLFVRQSEVMILTKSLNPHLNDNDMKGM